MKARVIIWAAFLGSLTFLVIGASAIAQSPIPPIPHPITSTPNCLGCHQNGPSDVPQISQNHSGRTNESCTLCHQTTKLDTPPTPVPEPTFTLPSAAPSIKFVPLDKYGCLSCHNNPDLNKTKTNGEAISLYVDASQVAQSAHRYNDCTTCHTTRPHEIPTQLTKLSLAEKCGSCHQYEGELHLQSVHGRQLTAGNPDVATCVDCHSPSGSPHDVRRVLGYDSPAYRKNIADTCSKCHGDEELMARYGILERIYESYMRSYHGRAMKLATEELKQLNKATCINCHGVHDIMSTKDPSSPVGTVANLAQTCESCHPGAGENYARGFLGHKEASLKDSPQVFFSERFFFWFTASVVAFGMFLVSMDVIRWGNGRHHRKED
ncbi:MAG: hypothetical protein HY664_00455 [Chloroflexi bacterium]|nr:hypothetical protein [Chloroflexota bacterium]